VRRQQCVGCNITKPHTRRYFYGCKTGKYGLRIKCKVCVRADVRSNRALKAEYYRSALVRRRRLDDGWRANRRAYHAAWRRTPHGRALTNELQRLRYRVAVLRNAEREVA
jgi:hypothetical protein